MGTYEELRDKKPMVVDLMWTVIWMALYFGTGVAFYMSVEGWDGWESLYFLMVTASTVGYGDLSPTTAWSRFFTIIYIFFGITTVFSHLGALVSQIFRPMFNCARDAVERVFPQATIDIDGDGTPDFKLPRDAATYYTKNLAGPICIITLMQICFAAVFVALVPDLPFGTAFYHCLVTITTVGYGDISLPNDGARMWSFVHIAVSVSLLAALLGDVTQLTQDRIMKLKKLSLLQGRLDIDLMKSLDTDGDGVTEYEFVIGMLQKLEMIKPSELEPFVKLFKQMDKDGSEKLTEADMELARIELASHPLAKVAPASSAAIRVISMQKSIKRMRKASSSPASDVGVISSSTSSSSRHTGEVKLTIAGGTAGGPAGQASPKGWA